MKITKKEYQVIQKRLEKGAIFLKDKWFIKNDPLIEKCKAKYYELCQLSLDYEIENDLLPI